MIELPVSITTTNTQRPALKWVDSVNINWTEFISFLRFYDEDILPKNTKHLKQLIQKSNPDEAAVLWALVGRSVFRSGQFIDAKRIYDFALATFTGNNDKARHFVLLEYCTYLRYIFQHDQVNNILNQMGIPYEKDELFHLHQYTRSATLLLKGDLTQITAMLELAEYFQSVSNYFIQSRIYLEVGNQLRREEQFKEVLPYYQRSEVIAAKHGFPQLLSDIYHCRGLYEYYSGNPQNAWKYYEMGLDYAVGFYQNGFLHVNMGWTHFQLGNLREAETNYRQALETFVDHGIFQQIPGACYYLGAICEAEEKLSEARQYYQQGFKTSTFLVENGFPLAGDRKKAVDGYVQFLENHPDTVSFLPRPDFSFAIDKTMKQIRATFQMAFLNTLFDKFKNVEAVVNQIQISRPGYFQIKRRNKDVAILPYPESVLKFTAKNINDNWKVFNKKFEVETMAFLYSAYGHNKKHMSQKLEMNYEHLVSLTAGMKRGLTVVEA